MAKLIANIDVLDICGGQTYDSGVPVGELFGFVHCIEVKWKSSGA